MENFDNLREDILTEVRGLMDYSLPEDRIEIEAQGILDLVEAALSAPENRLRAFSTRVLIEEARGTWEDERFAMVRGILAERAERGDLIAADYLEGSK